VKTTVEIQDELYARAQRKAQQQGRTMRSVIEDGIRVFLDGTKNARPEKYRLPDRAVGDPNGPNPLESMSWHELRDEIYAGR
jgi:hypothetical protein